MLLKYKTRTRPRQDQKKFKIWCFCMGKTRRPARPEEIDFFRVFCFLVLKKIIFFLQVKNKN